jgi:hypothetical protein
MLGFIRTIKIYLFGDSTPKKTREMKPREKRKIKTYKNFKLSAFDEQLMKDHNMVRKENKPTIPTPVSIQSTPVQHIHTPTTIVNVSTPAIVVPIPEPTIPKPIIIATPPPPIAISNPPAKKPIIIANKKDTKLDNQSKGIINNALPNNAKNKPKNDDNKNVRNNATNNGNAPKNGSGSKSNTDNAKKTGNTSNSDKPKKNVRFNDPKTKPK